MVLRIETPDDAVAVAMALELYLRVGLTAAGYREKHQNENPYYTQKRELADMLKKTLLEGRV